MHRYPDDIAYKECGHDFYIRKRVTLLTALFMTERWEFRLSHTMIRLTTTRMTRVSLTTANPSNHRY